MEEGLHQEIKVLLDNKTSTRKDLEANHNEMKGRINIQTRDHKKILLIDYHNISRNGRVFKFPFRLIPKSMFPFQEPLFSLFIISPPNATNGWKCAIKKILSAWHTKHSRRVQSPPPPTACSQFLEQWRSIS